MMKDDGHKMQTIVRSIVFSLVATSTATSNFFSESHAQQRRKRATEIGDAAKINNAVGLIAGLILLYRILYLNIQPNKNHLLISY